MSSRVEYTRCGTDAQSRPIFRTARNLSIRDYQTLWRKAEVSDG